MSKITLLISDLHLCESQPHLLRLFEYFMTNIAPKSEQLYILGDLFEVWVGDDNISPLNQQVIKQLNHYTTHHGELFIAHGNRDFLLGELFASQCGAKLIQEPHKMVWNNTRISLMHGDILCTDDTEYQEFRRMVRNEQWQTEFLQMPMTKRLEIATGLRQKSLDAQQQKSMQIMDVNSQAVKQCFLDNQCEWLIHGHTHREASHQVMLENGQTGYRIVLSDWNEKGHYLELNYGGFQSHYFALPSSFKHAI